MNQIRSKSDKHLFYEALDRRLSKNNSFWSTVQSTLRREGGGYAGELRVDRELGEARFYDSYVLLKHIIVGNESSYCQIDTLVIHARFILILEVKNIPGVLTYDEETHQLTRRRDNGPIEGMGNPVDQVKRSERMVRDFLEKHHVTLPVYGMIVFSNPASILERPFPDCFAIHVSGLYPALEKLHQRHVNQPTPKHDTRKIHQLFVHNEPVITFQPPTNLPTNLSAEIRTGVLCPDCNNAMTYRSKIWRCSQCGYKNENEHLRTLQEYRVLFSEALSTKQWVEFAGLNSVTTAKRILRESNLEKIGGNKNRKWFISKSVSRS